MDKQAQQMKRYVEAQFTGTWWRPLKPVLLLWPVMMCSLLTPQAWADKDPTRPAYYNPASAGKKTQYKLQSIIVGPQRKVAIINGKPLVEGERFGLGKIERIEKNQVSVRSGRSIIRLTLASQLVKRSSGEK